MPLFLILEQDLDILEQKPASYVLTGPHIFIQTSDINTRIIYRYTAPQSSFVPPAVDMQDEEEAISSSAAIFNLRNGNLNLNSPLIFFYRNVENVGHSE